MKTKKKRLIFVGAGNFARELISWIRLDLQEWSAFEFGGFLSDSPGSVADFPCYEPGIISTISDYVPDSRDSLVMAITDPRAKLEIAQKLEAKGAKFVGFIHPTALIGNHVQIGRGVVICPNVVISCHASIGDFVGLNLACTIGHDAKIGRGCTLSAHVDITGFADIGEGVFLGSHAVVLPHARVGTYAKVGAGSVVLRTVRAGATVMGVPSKQILP
jgi:sugar O-acyltransferase (sialic acid O-acetyltransferase NeuD family)